MKRQINWLLTLLAMMAAMASSAWETDIPLKNPGFEAGPYVAMDFSGGRWLDPDPGSSNWWHHYGGAGLFKSGGNPDSYLQMGWGGATCMARQFTGVQVTSGMTSLTLSAQVKNDNVGGGGSGRGWLMFTFTQNPFDENGSNLPWHTGPVFTAPTNGSWETFSYTVDVTDPSYVGKYIGVWLVTEASEWSNYQGWDNVTLRVTTATAIILQNPRFEEGPATGIVAWNSAQGYNPPYVLTYADPSPGPSAWIINYGGAGVDQWDVAHGKVLSMGWGGAPSQVYQYSGFQVPAGVSITVSADVLWGAGAGSGNFRLGFTGNPHDEDGSNVYLTGPQFFATTNWQRFSYTVSSSDHPEIVGKYVMPWLSTDDGNWGNYQRWDNVALDAAVITPVLTIERSGSNVQVAWSVGWLESTTNLANPSWSAVPGAVSPYTVPPTGPARFYRAVQAAGSFNRPAQILPGSNVTVDGNLSEWAGYAFAPLDQVYNIDGSSEYDLTNDIPEAYYAARWVSNKVYVAVKVRDTAHSFVANYVDWNAQDDVEIYLHTTGTGPANYLWTQADAQQYEIGIVNGTTDTVWTAMGGTNAVPSWANLSAAGKVDGQWIYYEAALTPFAQFSLSDSNAVVSSVLSVGQVIGLDVVAVGKDPSFGYTGMKSENLMLGKSSDYTKFGRHLIVR